MIKTMSTKEQIYLKFCEYVDQQQWEEARDLFKEVINMDGIELAHQMSDYYQEYVCKTCLGDRKVVEGNFGKEYTIDCPDCSIE